MIPQGIARRGFTLVELLVVIAVIAILIGVLLPSLAGARQVAQSMVALSNNRQLVIAQQGYSSSSDGWLAGPNTSGGIAVLTDVPGEAIVGSTGSDVPTQNFDWISPTVGTELGLSPNRAERMYQIWERFHCPRATRFIDELFGDATDGDDFDRVNKATPYRQVSYLAPASFHFSPYETGLGAVWIPNRFRNAHKEGSVWTQQPPLNNPCTLPTSYRPRTDLIARPDTKIAIADGTRFVKLGGILIGGTAAVLDFDSSPTTRFYGAFTSSGAIFNASNAYGMDLLAGAARGANVDVSMRYFDNEMHVGFFDGHADRITRTEAYGNVQWWYPRDSTFTAVSATEESKDAYDAGDKIP